MIIHDVADYIRQPVPRLPYYIQHLLPVGSRLLLCGKAGARKSWLASHMGFCIATGQEWLGFRTHQARVLIVNFEISNISYHDRLVKVGSHFELENLMLFQSSPSVLFLNEEDVFDSFLQDVNNIDPQVIILDCLSACFSADENNPKDMSGFIRNMEALKGENRSLVIVHHSNKNPMYSDPMDKVRGHTKLTGWVDTVLYMVRQPTATQLQFGKTRHATSELHSQNILFEDYLWSLRNGHTPEGGEL